MPRAKLERIVSCSSEDPAHPAKNLLLGRELNRNWRCREPGENSAIVVIQMDQPYTITGVDIGNNGSAFVEVFVSRSSTPDDFQVLLSMSTFMTPMDSRSESNKYSVRLFSNETLSESVMKEKWDRIKVICTQPFNKHVQYGLSFIVVHSSNQRQDVTLPTVKALGRFTLKNEDESDISVGSFFSRRKDFEAATSTALPLTGAAAVRDASSPSSLAAKMNNKKRKGSEESSNSQDKKRVKPKDIVESQTGAPGSPSNVNGKPAKRKISSTVKIQGEASGVADITSNNDLEGSKINNETHQTKAKRTTDEDLNSQSSHSSSRRKTQQQEKQNNSGNVTYKPFNKLFEGVEIVISGYVNPGRAEIREKALQMGAKYKPDWCLTSTHLICAFANTPKFQQVKGKGIIVTRAWVDECYQERKKLSWRRFAVDSQDRSETNGVLDPEVWELIPAMDISGSSPRPPASRRNNLATLDTRLGSDSEDSDDEIERIKAKQVLRKKEENKDADKNLSTNQEKNMMATKHNDGTRYNDSTDVDSEDDAERRLIDWSEKQNFVRSEKFLPHMGDFFKGTTFYISPNFSETENHSLTRYITAYGGKIIKAKDAAVQYIVSKEKYHIPKGSTSVCVRPDWIWECNDRQSLVPTSPYEPN